MRGGADTVLRPKEDEPQHTMANVYAEMLLQICLYYPGLPDVRTLTNTQIRFFYEGIRRELHRATAPQPAPKARRR